MTGNAVLELLRPERQENLEDQIGKRLRGMVRHIRVYQKDEGLVLQGQARTYYAKQLAQEAARQVTQVPILANDIEVL